MNWLHDNPLTADMFVAKQLSFCGDKIDNDTIAELLRFVDTPNTGVILTSWIKSVNVPGKGHSVYLHVQIEYATQIIESDIFRENTDWTTQWGTWLGEKKFLKHPNVHRYVPNKVHM